MSSRIFLLSPANCSGRRASQALAPEARFDIAERLRSPAGVPIGDLFAFISGLYFRGKLSYARRFATVPADASATAGSGVHIITPNAGLLGPDTPVTTDVVRAFALSSIDADNVVYRRPLEHSARMLHDAVGEVPVILLGSIASPKYVDVLLGIFGERLCFPADFVGRGDMSRGGLLLRQVAAGIELEYVPVAGAVRTGTRPPKLTPLPRRNSDGAA